MAQIRQNSPARVAEIGIAEIPANQFEFMDDLPAKAHSFDRPSAMAGLVMLEQGLYALHIGETVGSRDQVAGLEMPIIQVSAISADRDRAAEIIGISGPGETWLGREGGTVIVKSPPGGGHVLVTSYGPAAETVRVPQIEVRRLDRPRSNVMDFASTGATHDPEEIRTEIVLHMERLGDRRFPGQGWVGNPGKKLRIEAFSIRPLETLTARDIEFRAAGPKRRQTPWVTDAKLCGTRGQGLGLTGFAVRLAEHVGERFDVVYQGAFFESGIVGPNRNGEPCIPPMTDDQLEAINLRVIRRPARQG
jgi:hypothetical protein